MKLSKEDEKSIFKMKIALTVMSASLIGIVSGLAYILTHVII